MGFVRAFRDLRGDRREMRGRNRPGSHRDNSRLQNRRKSCRERTRKEDKQDTTERLRRARRYPPYRDSPRLGKSCHRRSNNTAGRKDDPCRNVCSWGTEQPVTAQVSAESDISALQFSRSSRFRRPKRLGECEKGRKSTLAQKECLLAPFVRLAADDVEERPGRSRRETHSKTSPAPFRTLAGWSRSSHLWHPEFATGSLRAEKREETSH